VIIILKIEYKKGLYMNIPLVDLKANYRSIKSEIDEAIQTILDNTSFIKGSPLEKFENRWAEMCGADFCIGVSSGTTALELILRASGLEIGKEIICPVNTFIATAESICNAGFKPVFCEIEETTGLIDPSKLEEVITENTKAIVIVDLYGQPADYDAVERICKDKNILIIQDAAQSHIAEYKGKRVGSYAYATSFSFYPGKNLGAYGDGGAIVTNDKDLADKIRMLNDHGRKLKYEHELVGFNYRMDTLQAAILSVKLKYIEQWTDNRRAIAANYHSQLQGVIPVIEKEDNRSVYHLFVLKTDRRDKLMDYLKDNDISSGIHYPIPLHLQPAFKYLEYKQGDFPVAEKFVKKIISLPIYPEMNKKSQDYIITKVNEFHN